MIYATLTIVACIAGLVQGVTGFGAGIIIMMALPYFLSIPQSAGITGAVSIVLCVMMVIRYYEDIKISKVILPAILYMTVCSFAISFSTMVNQALLKKALGAFLVMLAIYYLFFNKSNDNKELSLLVKIGCIVISAVCDAFFGIGGPLMVLYYMSMTSSTREFLGTLQVFFLINATYNTILRFFKGILSITQLPLIGIGAIGIIAGVLVANKIVDKLDEQLIKKLTYVMIGISGIINLI